MQGELTMLALHAWTGTRCRTPYNAILWQQLRVRLKLTAVSAKNSIVCKGRDAKMLRCASLCRTVTRELRVRTRMQVGLLELQRNIISVVRNDVVRCSSLYWWTRVMHPKGMRVLYIKYDHRYLKNATKKVYTIAYEYKATTYMLTVIIRPVIYLYTCICVLCTYRCSFV